MSDQLASRGTAGKRVNEHADSTIQGMHLGWGMSCGSSPCLVRLGVLHKGTEASLGKNNALSHSQSAAAGSDISGKIEDVHEDISRSSDMSHGENRSIFDLMNIVVCTDSVSNQLRGGAEKDRSVHTRSGRVRRLVTKRSSGGKSSRSVRYAKRST